MHMKRWSLAAAAATLALAVAGCGSDDGGDEESASGAEETTSAEAPAGEAPTLEAVLACLKKEGLEAEDESSSTGETIGIDYPAGRLVVKFEDTPEDAAAYASVAETNGETAVVKGRIAITVPADPGAETAQATVESCVEA
jgi:hypothetical protein